MPCIAAYALELVFALTLFETVGWVADGLEFSSI